MLTLKTFAVAAVVALPVLTMNGCGMFRFSARATDQSDQVLQELGLASLATAHRQAGPGPSLVAGDAIALRWAHACRMMGE